MGVTKYLVRGRTFWKVDEWLDLGDGRVVRYRKKRIPTREQAMALAAKAKTEAFEGRHFERTHASKLTVAEAWERYQPITKRDNDSWQTDFGRARHLLRHLGSRRAAQLSLKDVDEYRNRRFGEVTRAKKQPSPATLDREVALLHRMLNYAVGCGLLARNPMAGIRLLRKPNVRRVVISEDVFQKLLAEAEEELRPILLVAYDHGFRKSEILKLKWSQVDLNSGVIRLAPQDTKGGEHRSVYLTKRTHAAISSQPRFLRSEFVFVNQETGTEWVDIRKKFTRACAKVGLHGVWFHDLRRSFVTNARRRGVPESVVMKLSGHRTRSVFDRYNVVSEDDLRQAVLQIESGAERELANLGHVLDTFSKGAPPTPKANR